MVIASRSWALGWRSQVRARLVSCREETHDCCIDESVANIRRAALADGHGIGETHAASWRAAYGHIFDALFLVRAAESRRIGWSTSLERLLGSPGFVLVAERDNVIVGFSHAGPDSRDRSAAEIYGFYTHPAVWGSGIATLLMVDTCSELADRWDEVMVWTLRDAGRARRFYEKAGFRATGEQTSETLTDWTTGERVERPAVEYSKSIEHT
jgi:GNAT superfamily N-acetyltransferase